MMKSAFVRLLLCGFLLVVAPLGQADSPSATAAVNKLVETLAARAGDTIKACQPYSDRTNGLYGGYFDMNGTVCSTSMSFDVIYSGFSGASGVTASGTATISGSVDSPYYPSRMTLTFDGGPIYYDYYGQSINVVFQSVTFNFRIWYGSVSLTSVSGGLLLNGTTYVSMDQSLAGLMY